MSDTNENSEFVHTLLEVVQSKTLVRSVSARFGLEQQDRTESALEKLFATRPVDEMQAIWNQAYGIASEEERLDMDESVLMLMDDRGFNADEARQYIAMVMSLQMLLDGNGAASTHRGKKKQKHKNKH